MEVIDCSSSKASLLEMQNTHKIVQNLRWSWDIAQLSWYVNHLVFLLVHTIGILQVPLANHNVNISELGNVLRWHSFFIKKMQQKNISFYFVNRGDGDIIFWRTQSLEKYYLSLVDMLLQASSKTIWLHESLIKTLQEISDDDNNESF